MSEWLSWCSCHRRILTTEQMEKSQPCLLCQQEHAEKFKERFDKIDDTVEFNR